jgi:D-amino-acid dehydrogenase
LLQTILFKSKERLAGTSPAAKHIDQPSIFHELIHVRGCVSSENSGTRLDVSCKLRIMQTSHQLQRAKRLSVLACNPRREFKLVARFAQAPTSKRDRDMKICVLGAGVIGLTTAWWLAEAGHDVTIIDRHEAAAAGASAANGGQLSYTFVTPLASPATLLKLPSLLMLRDGPIRIRAGFDPALVHWGARFLLACRSGVVRETISAQLTLAALSRVELERLNQAMGLVFGLKTAGKLVVYRTETEFNSARAAISVDSDINLEQRVLTPTECLALEPALRLATRDLAGGIFTASEQVGDCAAFCIELSRRTKQRNNIAWSLRTQIIGPVRSSGRLVAVETDNGHVQADCFVLCLGSQSRTFARACGFYLPIYPLKGYSITLTAEPGARALRHSITDFERKLVFAPLAVDGQPVVRVAGIADFEGDDTTVDPSRIDILQRAAAEVLGMTATGDVRPWCGLRPTTPDSRPIIGWSPLQGLFINSGHGMLGWTLACGSAKLTADLVDRKPVGIEAGAFAVRRSA